jgi:hypothetical protein
MVVSDSNRETARVVVLAHLEDELWAQKEKHGSNEMFYNRHKLAILIEEVGEVGHAINEKMPKEELYNELIQVAACAVAWAERLRCTGSEEWL